MKHLFTFLLCSVMTLSAAAQRDTRSSETQAPKHDVILKVNGDEMVGTVKEIGDSAIKFSHEGESLVYSFKKEDIIKITYASGRIEVFNKPPLASERKAREATPSQNTTGPGIGDHHNKVAILPFAFLRDNQGAGNEIAYKVQQDAFELLSEHSGTLTVIDPRTTNALLMKAGITRENLMGYTMDEICNILNVEYLVEGTVAINKGVQTSSTYDQYKGTTNESRNKTRITGSSTTTGGQTYITVVTLNVFTDKNTAIFRDSHRALLASYDASYSSPLKYLLKRCPLYRK